MKSAARNLSILSLFLVVFATKAWTREPMPLPDFEITSLEGQPVRTGQFALQDRWLLIYIKPSCTLCESLLHILKEDPSPAAFERVIVIAGGMNTEDLQNVAENFSELDQASWYSDLTYQYFMELKLKGAPVVLGINQGIVAWSIQGVLPNTRDLRSILTSWINR
jgi:hypothetical protein